MKVCTNLDTPYGNAQTLHKPITNSLPQPNFFDGIAFAAMLAKVQLCRVLGNSEVGAKCGFEI